VCAREAGAPVELNSIAVSRKEEMHADISLSWCFGFCTTSIPQRKCLHFRTS